MNMIELTQRDGKRIMFDPQIAEAANVCENVTGIEHSDKQCRADDQNVGATLNEDPFMGLEEEHIEIAKAKDKVREIELPLSEEKLHTQIKDLEYVILHKSILFIKSLNRSNKL